MYRIEMEKNDMIKEKEFTNKKLMELLINLEMTKAELECLRQSKRQRAE